MTDFSHQANQIVESVRNAMYDMTEFARETRDHARSDVPTPFQRAVIGGLVLVAHAAELQAVAACEATGISVGREQHWISHEEQRAAMRAVAPFLDETPRPA